MGTYSIIKLTELSPLHIGTGKENYDFSANQLHSDTISAALASIRCRLGKSDDIESFMNSFSISSAFPYIDSHLFLPRPIGKVDINIIDSNNNYASLKQLKKIKYFEVGTWNRLVNNETIELSRNQILNEFAFDNKSVQFNLPYQAMVTQRVTVPRSGDDTATPFFFDWTFFSPNAGLYFITDAKGELFDEILNLFKLLGEQGIGTDKNIGGGKFNVEHAQIDLCKCDNANALITLSLYIPTKDELSNIKLESSRYDLLLRGGYMSGSRDIDLWHIRKKSIYMFNVGSVFSTQHSLNGKIVDLCPTEYNAPHMHPVYRSGRPFVLPIKI